MAAARSALHWFCHPRSNSTRLVSRAVQVLLWSEFLLDLGNMRHIWRTQAMSTSHPSLLRYLNTRLRIVLAMVIGYHRRHYSHSNNLLEWLFLLSGDRWVRALWSAAASFLGLCIAHTPHKVPTCISCPRSCRAKHTNFGICLDSLWWFPRSNSNSSLLLVALFLVLWSLVW